MAGQRIASSSGAQKRSACCPLVVHVPITHPAHTKPVLGVCNLHSVALPLSQVLSYVYINSSLVNA